MNFLNHITGFLENIMTDVFCLTFWFHFACIGGTCSRLLSSKIPICDMTVTVKNPYSDITKQKCHNEKHGVFEYLENGMVSNIPYWESVVNLIVQNLRDLICC